MVRKTTPYYSTRFAKIEEGRIVRINIHNWANACNRPPVFYINRMYKGYYTVVDIDSKGFNVLCLQKKERFQ